MGKRWKPNETSYLKRYAAKRRLAELAERFDTDEAAVRAKLDELGLEAVDHQRASGEPDPGIAVLEEGVQALHSKKYAQAEKLFARAEAEAAQTEVANLARRYQAAARSRRQEKSAAAPPDPYLEAVYERNLGNLDAALEICSRGGRQSKDERFAHLAASIHALKGDLDKAAKFLEVAIEMNPRNRVLAYNDSDFAVLRESPEYASLFAAGD
jgi:tetratricopeptide (TPR) repeat protein